MELEIHEITNSEEKTRQNNHLQSFKAELKRLQHEYNLTQRRVQRSVLPTLQEKNAKFLKIQFSKKLPNFCNLPENWYLPKSFNLPFCK